MIKFYDFPGGNCPGAIILEANGPGQLSGDNNSRGNFLGGNCPRTICNVGLSVAWQGGVGDLSVGA